jgi:hypothetical protein
MPINPRTESYIDNFVKSTTPFGDIIWRFANTVVSEGKSGKYAYDAMLISFHGVKF